MSWMTRRAHVTCLLVTFVLSLITVPAQAQMDADAQEMLDRIPLTFGDIFHFAKQRRLNRLATDGG